MCLTCQPTGQAVSVFPVFSCVFGAFCDFLFFFSAFLALRNFFTPRCRTLMQCRQAILCYALHYLPISVYKYSIKQRIQTNRLRQFRTGIQEFSKSTPHRPASPGALLFKSISPAHFSTHIISATHYFSLSRHIFPSAFPLLIISAFSRQPHRKSAHRPERQPQTVLFSFRRCQFLRSRLHFRPHHFSLFPATVLQK